MEEKPISIELPNNIECAVESTDAAIKNQTASSSYKPAILDCGIKIDVPPFVESGEKIILEQRTGRVRVLGNEKARPRIELPDLGKINLPKPLMKKSN